MYTYNYYKIFLLFFFIVYKNEQKEHKFWQSKYQEKWLLQQKQKIFNIDDIDGNKILVSKKEQYGEYNTFKYFIGYNDNNVIRLLYLELSQMTGYINEFEKNKIAMSLMVKDKQLFENYNKIWKKIKRLVSIDFESETTYGDDDDKYIKAKIKTYKDNIITNFYNKIGCKKVPKEKIPHECLSIIIIDSVLYAYEKYFPQTFLEECKYAKTNVKTNNYIDKELKLESDSDSDNDSDSDIYIKEQNLKNVIIINKF